MPPPAATPRRRSSGRRRFYGVISAAGCGCGACRRSSSASTNPSPIRIGSSRYCAICTRKRRSGLMVITRRRSRPTMIALGRRAAPTARATRRPRIATGMTTTTADTTAARVADEIRRRHRFVVASHARPDGDAIGSSLAMALALRRLGKDARVVSRDRVPPQMQGFPGVDSIDVVESIDDPGDAVIILECGDAQRTGIAGLERGYVINIDHHPGNALYGAVNWLDLSAAACGEMVFDLIGDRKSTRLNSSHLGISYAVFCLKKKKK